MKLFATVKSEGSVKKQGGQKFLIVTITGKDGKLIYNLRFDARDNGILEIHERNEDGEIRENTIVLN